MKINIILSIYQNSQKKLFGWNDQQKIEKSWDLNQYRQSNITNEQKSFYMQTKSYFNNNKIIRK